MCMSCIVFINLLGQQERKLYFALQIRKKRKKSNLVNFPHDFYFLQEDGAVFHLLVYILHAAYLFIKMLRKPHHGVN